MTRRSTQIDLVPWTGPVPICSKSSVALLALFLIVLFLVNDAKCSAGQRRSDIVEGIRAGFIPELLEHRPGSVFQKLS
jgi:hypothetical protein